jgi:hypothetical protein
MQFEQVLAAEMRRRRAMAEQMANEEQILREARIWQQQAAAQGRRPAPRAEAIDFAVGPYSTSSEHCRDRAGLDAARRSPASRRSC